MSCFVPLLLNSRPMPMVLKISDYDGRGVLAFDLKHLLPLVDTVGADLTWHVIPGGETTWFLGQLTALNAVDEFAKQVESSENGVELTWRELLELADSVNQTVWGTFVGVKPEVAWPRFTDMFSDDCRYVDRATSSFYDSVEIAFQAVDSSYWLAYLQDADVRERIRALFDHVKVIDVVPTK